MFKQKKLKFPFINLAGLNYFSKILFTLADSTIRNAYFYALQTYGYDQTGTIHVILCWLDVHILILGYEYLICNVPMFI